MFPLMQDVLVFSFMCHTPGERSYFTDYTSLIKEEGGGRIFVPIKVPSKIRFASV